MPASPETPESPNAELVEPDSLNPPNPAQEYGLAVLKGAIAAIPFAGGLINELLFEARSRLKQHRLQLFFAIVADRVKGLAADKIDHEYVHTEEFSDLVEDVVLRAAHSRSEAKRKHLAEVLVKGLGGARAPNFAPLFLSILDEMSEDELRIYGDYYRAFIALRERRASGRTIEMKPIDYSETEIHGLPPDVFKQVVQSLIRKGLLFDDSHGRLSTRPFTIVEPTELGASFYDWIVEKRQQT